ncbi:MAG TPA: UDP-N-acetylmuramoyl-L-alanyl-D-glutamate--2,6-diaminopimelate ligase [Bacteroidota bacterium]|nr:UDP-N-acetylmuramoyl-L-alanyl-D-glutamate--2,6-diaminopimelate ligase [Bacteroidota bacterium]
MTLNDLLGGVRVTKLYSGMYGKMVLTQDISVRNIRYDSRRVGPGDLFVALRGTAENGHRFIDDAIAAGASAVVVDDDASRPDTYFMHTGVLKVLVPDARAALAALSANFYGRPADRLQIVGITGTNGKTTTSHLIRAILAADGKPAGLIGTIDYRIADRVLPATHTTPESLELHELLAEMVRAGCVAAVMEVSSHALAMSRVAGIGFGAAVFTNLTQDHLDYHGSMEDYFRAKKKLFDSVSPGGVAVVNADDPYGARMLEGTPGRKITYGFTPACDVRATGIELRIDGSRCTVVHAGKEFGISSPLTGKFNIQNILASCAAGLGLGIAPAAIEAGILSVQAVPGRFERIVAPRAGWTAIVDYAHTPDALDNCLRTIRELLGPAGGRRIITVFGCGGNRDRGKRPIMGRIASAWSDITIVTSDNPRNEDPVSIIAEIVSGMPAGGETYTEVNRHEAIRAALGKARRGDVVLVAGKGHETYQVIGATRHHFDDREEVRSFIQENG